MSQALAMMARQILSSATPDQKKRFNPRPPGVIQPGSATESTLEYLRTIYPRSCPRSEIVDATGRTPKSVDWACLYLRELGLIDCYLSSVSATGIRRHHRYVAVVCK